MFTIEMRQTIISAKKNFLKCYDEIQRNKLKNNNIICFIIQHSSHSLKYQFLSLSNIKSQIPTCPWTPFPTHFLLWTSETIIRRMQLKIILYRYICRNIFRFLWRILKLLVARTVNRLFWHHYGVFLSRWTIYARNLVLQLKFCRLALNS